MTFFVVNIFCAPVNRIIIVRKGWSGESVVGTSLPLPSSGPWHQRIRRRWRSRNTVVGGGDRDPRWPGQSQESRSRLGCFGPRDIAAKEQIQEALRRWNDSRKLWMHWGDLGGPEENDQSQKLSRSAKSSSSVPPSASQS